MATTTVSGEKETADVKVYDDTIQCETRECLQFIDLTDQLIDLVRKSGVRQGMVNVQTKHTTTAMMVGENEPLLLEDMKRILEKLAPECGDYQHDNFGIRTINLCADEAKNGHSHCKGMFLRSSETLNIVGGKLQLGQWQRVFLIELDRARTRIVSVMVMGQTTPSLND